MTGDSAGWSFASARKPARFAAAEQSGSPQAEHAFKRPATLCGIPEEQLIVYRHLFSPGSIRACPRCHEQAAAAPTVPCSQELLHDKVLAAAPGPLRAQLLDALRSGAKITIWVNGPGGHVARYAGPDRITHGAEAVRSLLSSGDRIGIARVAQPSGEFLVVLPERQAPLIAFAATLSTTWQQDQLATSQASFVPRTTRSPRTHKVHSPPIPYDTKPQLTLTGIPSGRPASHQR